jgi:hypothetical protein
LAQIFDHKNPQLYDKDLVPRFYDLLIMATVEIPARMIPETIKPNIITSENQPLQYGSGWMIWGMCFKIPANARIVPRKIDPMKPIFLPLETHIRTKRSRIVKIPLRNWANWLLIPNSAGMPYKKSSIRWGIAKNDSNKPTLNTVFVY